MSQTPESLGDLYKCPACGHHDPDLINAVTEVVAAGSMLAAAFDKMRSESVKVHVAARLFRRHVLRALDELPR